MKFKLNKLSKQLDRMGLKKESEKVNALIKKASLDLSYQDGGTHLQALFLVALEEYYDAVSAGLRDFYEGDDKDCARNVAHKAFDFFNKAEISPDLPKEIIKEITYWECNEGWDTWFGYNSLFKAMAEGGTARSNYPFSDSGGQRVQLAWTLFKRENERRWQGIQREKALEGTRNEGNQKRKPHINDAERVAPAPAPADGQPNTPPTTPQNPWGEMIRHPSPHR